MGLFDSHIAGRDPRYEGQSMLGAQLYTMPSQAAADTAYQQYFSGARTNQFNRTLFGGGATQTTVPYYNSATGGWDNTTINVDASPGLVHSYGRMAKSLGKQSLKADTYGGGIMAELQRQAMDGLRNPYALSPSEEREVIQAGLNNPALSSFGAQPRLAYQTYSNLGSAAREAAAGRRQFASNVADQGYRQYTAPGQSMASTLFSGSVSDAMNATPNLFDPYSQYGMDLANTSYNAAAASSIADMNAKVDAANPD